VCSLISLLPKNGQPKRLGLRTLTKNVVEDIVTNTWFVHCRANVDVLSRRAPRGHDVYFGANRLVTEPEGVDGSCIRAQL
jgi:hypothetical protein